MGFVFRGVETKDKVTFNGEGDKAWSREGPELRLLLNPFKGGAFPCKFTNDCKGERLFARGEHGLRDG